MSGKAEKGGAMPNGAKGEAYNYFLRSWSNVRLRFRTWPKAWRPGLMHLSFGCFNCCGQGLQPGSLGCFIFIRSRRMSGLGKNKSAMQSRRLKNCKINQTTVAEHKPLTNTGKVERSINAQAAQVHATQLLNSNPAKNAYRIILP